jgi:hypothetical protein
MPYLLYKSLKKGETVKEFCDEIAISRTKFYRWLKLYPEFSNAFQEGREAGKEIWKIRCTIPCYDSRSVKRLPNTSFHRLLATNIYGREFLPPNKKVSKETREIAELKRLLFEAG